MLGASSNTHFSSGVVIDLAKGYSIEQGAFLLASGLTHLSNPLIGTSATLTKYVDFMLYSVTMP